MKENQNKTTYIIFRILGVFTALILIAGIVFSAYRFGQHRGMLAASELVDISGDIESAPWTVSFIHWRGYSILEDLLIICVVIFLLRMVTGLIMGPGFHFRGRPRFHRCYHRWYAAYPWEPFRASKVESTDSKDDEGAAEL